MLISRWASKWRASVIPAEAFGPLQPGDVVYRVKHLFTTRDGSWDPSDKDGSLPQWARDTYLKPMSDPQYNDDGGADHNLFGAVEQGGRLVPALKFGYWTGDNQNRAERYAKRHGWANIPIWNIFYPDQGSGGAWLGPASTASARAARAGRGTRGRPARRGGSHPPRRSPCHGRSSRPDPAPPGWLGWSAA